MRNHNRCNGSHQPFRPTNEVTTMGQMLRCKQCDAEMALTPLPPIEGEEHGLLMKIDGLPTLRCPNGHTRFVSPTFPSMFLDQLLSAPDLVQLDSAAEKGFLRKR